MYDELIKQMMACCKGMPCEDANCGFNPKSNLDCIEQLLTRAADAIEELQKQLRKEKVDNVNLTGWLAEEHAKSQWISVTERLPENRDMVLATIDGVVYIAFYGNYMWKEVETYSIFYPTHWMPLPEPPKEG